MARMISRLVSQLRGVVVFSLFVCSVNHTSGKFLLMLMCCGWKQMVFVLVIYSILAEVCEVLEVQVAVGVGFMELTFVCCHVRV